jgi:nitrate reductase delta subunit
MGIFSMLAAGLDYPSQGLRGDLRAELETHGGQTDPAAPRLQRQARRGILDRLGRFLDEVEGLEPGAWEELYTATFDLDPAAAPYLGYQAWGDSYERGQLLATLGRAAREAGSDPQGELADHLVPVLAYLDATRDPLPALRRILTPSLEAIRRGIDSRNPSNPYLHLLDACLIASKDLEHLQEGAFSPAPAAETAREA